MQITHYIRDRRPGNYSIEEIFRIVRELLSSEDVVFNQFRPEKPFDVESLLKSRHHQGQINHITGDINYYSFALNREKTILTVHDIGYIENKNINPLKRAIFKKLWMDWPLKRSKYISTVSEFTKSKIIDYFHVESEKIVVIPNPIDEIFKYAPLPNNEKLTILQIGSGSHKNLLGLINAIENIDCSLIIVGNPSAAEMSRLSKLSIKCTILKNLTIQEVYDKYLHADIVYFASFIEGFGMPIIEAQAVGRPVITSNFGAMKEVAGEGAYFVDPYLTSDIRKAVLDIKDNLTLRKFLVKKGLNNRQRFTNQAIADQYLALYKKVFAESQV